jgi:hypothetical protein
MLFPLEPVDERQLSAAAETAGPAGPLLEVGKKLNELILKVNKIERDIYEEGEPVEAHGSDLVGIVLESNSPRELGNEITEWAQTRGVHKTVVKIQATSPTTVLLVYRVNL